MFICSSYDMFIWKCWRRRWCLSGKRPGQLHSTLELFSIFLHFFTQPSYYSTTYYFTAIDCTESIHCREEGCIGKYIPRGPRDFPRAEGDVFPNASRLEAVYGHGHSDTGCGYAAYVQNGRAEDDWSTWGFANFPLHSQGNREYIEKYYLCWSSLLQVHISRNTSIQCNEYLQCFYNKCVDILIAWDWACLHHCWSIVSVFRVRVCSWYSP